MSSCERMGAPPFTSRSVMKGFCISILALSALPASGQSPAVLTRNGNNARTGVYEETGITVESLKRTGITLRTTIPVVGDARGMEAQPLILPGVKTAKGIRDVMVLPSLANVVRGVDAHTGEDLWDTTLGTPIHQDRATDIYGTNDHVGVLSTGVIDPNTHRAYIVAAISPDGSPVKAVHHIFTLDVVTGAVLGNASFAELRNGSQAYTDTPRKQRCSLVLVHVGVHAIVLGAHGRQLENGTAPAGALFAFDATVGKLTAWQPMARRAGAGIWMGSSGLVADAQGRVYGQTGNGDFSGADDLGESIFGAEYIPARGITAAAIHVFTHFTPFSDRGRIGLDPTVSSAGAASQFAAEKPAGVSAPEEAKSPRPVGGAVMMPMETKVVASHDANTGEAVPLTYPKNPTKEAWADSDLGSGGCVLLAGAHFTDQRDRIVCGGKDSALYEAYADNMGNTMPADFANQHANCAKLAAPPVWGGISPGNVDICSQDQTALDFFPNGKSAHLHSTPVAYDSPKDGLTLWVGAENAAVHKWLIDRSGVMHYAAEGREKASDLVQGGTGGMSGSACAVSSNQGVLGTGIIWCIQPRLDSNRAKSPGRLVAYSADDVSEDADGSHLVKLWDSSEHGIAFSCTKFTPPIIWDGSVIVPDFDGSVLVFKP